MLLTERKKEKKKERKKERKKTFMTLNDTINCDAIKWLPLYLNLHKL